MTTVAGRFARIGGGKRNMRMLKKNKQQMHYALPNGDVPIYKTDKTGNIIFIEVDGEKVPVETGECEQVYGDPVEFRNGISGKLSEALVKEFGIDDTTLYAQMDTEANEFPIVNGTLIWRKSEIKYKDDEKTRIVPSSADYIVSGILDEGLNVWNYLLKRVLE